MKKVWGVVLAALLVVAMMCGCSSGGDTASSTPSESAAASEAPSESGIESETPVASESTTASEAPVESESGGALEASAENVGSTDLDASGDIHGLTYKYSSTWEPVEMSEAVAYGFTVGTDVTCSITLAAMDAAVVDAAESSGTDIAEAMLTTLEVTDPQVSDSSFKGTTCQTFTATSGVAESQSAGAEGYVIPAGDYYYILLFISTDMANTDAAAVWTAFTDSVTLPA